MNQKDGILVIIDGLITSLSIIKVSIEKDFAILGLPKAQLDNAGILLKNKVIMLSHYFENKGYSFFPGDAAERIPVILGSEISLYLTNLVQEAVTELMSYDRLCHDMIGKRKINKASRILSGLFTGSILSSKQSEQLENILDRYKGICDKIFNFSLERDLYDVIVEGFKVSDYLQTYIYRGSRLDEILHSLGCEHVFEKLLENYGPQEKLEGSKKARQLETLNDEKAIISKIVKALSQIRDEEQAQYLKNRFNMTCSYCNSENLSTEEKVSMFQSVLSEIEEQLDKEKQKHM